MEIDKINKDRQNKQNKFQKRKRKNKASDAQLAENLNDSIEITSTEETEKPSEKNKIVTENFHRKSIDIKV